MQLDVVNVFYKNWRGVGMSENIFVLNQNNKKTTIEDFYEFSWEPDKYKIYMDKNSLKQFNKDEVISQFEKSEYYGTELFLKEFLLKYPCDFFDRKSERNILIKNIDYFVELTRLSNKISINDIKGTGHLEFLKKLQQCIYLEYSNDENLLKKLQLFVVKEIYDRFYQAQIKEDLKSFFVENEKFKEEVQNDLVYAIIPSEHPELLDLNAKTITYDNIKVCFQYDDLSENNENFDLDIDNDINFLELTHESNMKSCIFLGSIKSLYKMYNKYYMKLFNKNIRFYFKNSNVDNSIMNSLISNGKNFQVLHNGITIVCKNFKTGKDKVFLTEPSIVNGAQTVSNISRLIKDNIISVSEFQNSYIICKIIETENSDQIKEICSAANTQKPIRTYESFANSDSIKFLKKELKKFGIQMVTKRGESNYGDKDLKITSLDVAKIIKAAITQEPGSAYNAYSEDLFDKKSFQELFGDVDSDNNLEYRKQNFNVLIVMLAEIWRNIKEEHIIEENEANYTRIKAFKTSGLTLFISFAVYKIFSDSKLSEDFFSYIEKGFDNYKSNDELQKDIENSFNPDDLYEQCFNKYLLASEEDFNASKIFKSNELYDAMLKGADYDKKEVLKQIKNLFIEKVGIE